MAGVGPGGCVLAVTRSDAVSWLIEPFEYAFMQRALLAGLFASVSCALVGTWVVLRRVAFFGDALGHGIIPGVAVATLLGVALPLGAAVSAAIMVGGVTAVTRLRRLGEDTAIGLLFVVMLGLGVIIISRSRSFAVDVTALLFGSVLGVRVVDVWLAFGAALVTVVAVVVGHRAFLALTVDERIAQLAGLRPAVAQIALLGLVALAVVASFQTVGALLVFALLIAPAASAALVARRVVVMMLLAVVFGWSAVVGGLLASFHFDLAAGGAIAVLAVGQFAVVASVRQVRRRVRPSGLGSGRAIVTLK